MVEAAIFVSGFKGSGKRQFAQSLGSILRQDIHANNGIINCVDIGGIVGCFLDDKSSDLGKEINKNHQNGEPLKDDLVFKAFSKWLTTETKRVQSMKVLIVSGAPRNMEQLKLQDFFYRTAFFFLDASFDKANQIAKERKIENRVFRKRWQEHVQHTRPAAIKGQAVWMDRKRPNNELLEIALKHLLKKGILPSKIMKGGLNHFFNSSAVDNAGKTASLAI